jgi:hypothetical protein
MTLGVLSLESEEICSGSIAIPVFIGVDIIS